MGLDDLLTPDPPEPPKRTKTADSVEGLRPAKILRKATFLAQKDPSFRNNGGIENVLKLTVYAADQADLRQWSTLPESLQIARIPLKAGKYNLQALGVGYANDPSGEHMPDRQIEIKPGQKLFVSWRSWR